MIAAAHDLLLISWTCCLRAHVRLTAGFGAPALFSMLRCICMHKLACERRVTPPAQLARLNVRSAPLHMLQQRRRMMRAGKNM